MLMAHDDIGRDIRIKFLAADRKQRREALYKEVAQLVLVNYRYMLAADRKRVLQLVIHKALEQEDEQNSLAPWL